MFYNHDVGSIFAISDDSTTASPSGNTAGRGTLTSDKLYTKIPGIEVLASKTNVDVTPLVPLSAKSQFIPDRVSDSNDYDFMT
ncbi:uncharacterized protein BXIN_0893 [Babesia sp. Xinjiang]|uniref:uncharacterized protein n=1 Tax=Babesia sp. Xinjiang TaxID=462227 RepID=UPI000A23BB1C|nr:uncharacterized protein BXIN_0893 [Babesia sp. Xinjiang]ORM41245.1 hypothetical protein BXIN_0893 [Babesia sp. Xinjiang]